jgi:hypothetical protein
MFSSPSASLFPESVLQDLLVLRESDSQLPERPKSQTNGFMMVREKQLEHAYIYSRGWIGIPCFVTWSWC